MIQPSIPAQPIIRAAVLLLASLALIASPAIGKEPRGKTKHKMSIEKSAFGKT